MVEVIVHPHVKAGTLQHSHLEIYCGSVRINNVFCVYSIASTLVFVWACDCFIILYKDIEKYSLP